MALNVFDDWEDGDANEWNNYYIQVDTTRSYSGSYASHGEINQENIFYLGNRSFPNNVQTVEFYWQETFDSYGGGYYFLDDSGNRLAGIGTSNPEWIYTDPSTSSGKELYSGDGYDRWIRLRCDFDYSNYDVTYTFEDQSSGTQQSVTVTLEADAQVSQIQLVNAENEQSLWGGSTSDLGDGISSYYHWTDYIRIAEYLQAPSNVSVTVNNRNTITVSWDDADGASEYTVLRADTSGGSFSQIATVNDDNSASYSYEDPTLKYNEDYYYKVEAIS